MAKFEWTDRDKITEQDMLTMTEEAFTECSWTEQAILLRVLDNIISNQWGSPSSVIVKRKPFVKKYSELRKLYKKKGRSHDYKSNNNNNTTT